MRNCWLLAVALLTAAGCSDGGFMPTMTPPAGSAAVLLAAGDIGDCTLQGAELTGRLLDGMAGTVTPLGDLAYPNGSHLDFGRCYHPFWGRHLSRTRPVPGNHEYETANAVPYFEYFGDLGGPPGAGYYAYSRAGWLILALNSEVDTASASAQVMWMRNELSVSSARCTLAYFHKPLFSSGPNGDNPHMRVIVRTLYEAGADVVLAAHDHSYERFAPQNADGGADPIRGIRMFVVGTGGARLTPQGTPKANSQMRFSEWGVLKVTLHPAGYEWEFVPASGGSFRDSGTGECH
jgi:acid phosphatase type 7